jgi:stage II sporulation protein D
MTRILPVIAATLLIALVAASVASAKTTFTIRGAGFGHGVGMSQYGAMGYAQQGRNAAEILAHYYTGTALGTTDPNQQVRVLLVPQTKAARITGARQAGTRKLDPKVTYTLKRRGISQVELSANGRRLATFSAPLQVAGDGGITSLSGQGSYRGVLEFEPNVFNGLQVINSVGLEDYLQGVVPAESPASWPAEALKAQAIAARTYAITTAKSDEFDHYADTRSQVYKGVGIEVASTNRAIADTRGQVVTYQGQPIVTYFFSTSGGRTESVENTTLGDEPKPWLKSVEDPYDDVSPRHRWTLKPSKASVAKKLGGLVKGSFKGIRVTKRGESPRIMTAEVVGSRGVTETDGATLRARLGLYDTWASFTAIKSVKGDASGGARASSFEFMRRNAVGALSGSVIGPPRGTQLTIQRRVKGDWRDVGRVPTRAGGAYRWIAHARGSYRVLADGVAGPSVNF